MGGGTHWAEWIIPAIGAGHLAYNSGVNAAGYGDAKIASPGSQLAKRRDAEDAHIQKEGEQRQLLSQQKAQEKQTLAESQPDEIRRRATAASRALGETGKRPTASQFLAG